MENRDESRTACMREAGKRAPALACLQVTLTERV